MKLKAKLSIGLTSATFIVVPTLILASCKSNEKTSLDSTLDIKNLSNPDVFSIGTFNSEILSEEDRVIQNEYYNSEAWRLYHDDYNFRYPAQDYNYEKNNQNFFSRNSKASDRIDGFDVVFNERVTNDAGQYINANGDVVTNNADKIKYSEGNWILNEIKNNRLKKHRAADGMFLNDISNIKSVTKKFEISTATTGNLTLGLYVPAGEPIEITFDDDSWELIKDRRNAINFSINQNMWDNRDKIDANGNSESGKISNRYPFIKTTFGSNAITDKTFKIGSPFGGGLSININQNITSPGTSKFPLFSQIQNLKFTIKGAIPCLYYQDGITQEQEWYDQLQKAANNELAPVLQAWSPYFSLSINFNGKNKVGGVNVTDLIYPVQNFKKWNDFMFLSYYYQGNDISGSLQRLDMEFCDDIWGGAAAWGGGRTFYCPTDWGVNSFFYKPVEEVFAPRGSWGVFHEINHCFQQNSAFFHKNTHGETNQVTSFNLSVISDVTRFRNEINFSGELGNSNINNGWQYLDTPYSIIKNLYTKNGNADEYPIYSLLLFFMGSKNYVEYVRKDVREHPSNASTWTGLSEIARISDTFKLNMWPAFLDYSQYWSDWITDYNTASADDKSLIDRLNNSYLAADFVANQYACGSYLYNSETEEYNYTGDTMPAFQIPPIDTYTFDFENMIISTNKNFKFSQIKIPQKTKLGVSLEFDPTNNKKVKYTPDLSKISEIDEFDVEVIPGNWNNKPAKYVPSYKFKIKIRQQIASPTLETFPVLNRTDANQMFSTLNQMQPEYKVSGRFNAPLFQDNSVRGIKIKYKFVAPEDGKYVFKNTYDDYIRIYVNNKLEYRHDHDQQSFIKTYEKEMKKGDTLDFENQIINTGGAGGFNLQVTCNDKVIDVTKQILSSNIGTKLGTNYIAILNDPKYQYKIREIDREIFNKSLTAVHNLSTYSIDNQIIESNKYVLSSPVPGNNKQNLINIDTINDNVWEKWGNDDRSPCTIQLDYTFNEPQKIASIFVAGRTNNWWNARPTKIKVIGYKNDNDTNPIIIHDGSYGTQFNDRSNDVSKMNFSNPEIVKKVSVILTNEDTVNGNKTALSLKWVKLSDQKFLQLSNSYSFNNPLINVSSGWAFRKNDDYNSSAVSGFYIGSINNNNKISFNLNNSNGFSIIGKLNDETNTTFDVYINGVLYNVDKPISKKAVYNDALFTYRTDNPANLKVEIVTKK